MTRSIRLRAASLLVATAGALFLGGCGDDEDLPEPTGDREGTEVVPGEEGPVD